MSSDISPGRRAAATTHMAAHVLPTWMRRALLATAAMNLVGGVAFLPPAGALRALVGMPEGGHPLYLATVSMFVLLFGVAYLWLGLAGEANRLFITLAAAGKLSFFALLVCFWAMGEVSGLAPLSGVGDLIFGVLFVIWLVGAGQPPNHDAW